MKERPILFSGDMVRAILEGRKTQTRRVMKPQPPAGNYRYDGVGDVEKDEDADPECHWLEVLDEHGEYAERYWNAGKCPYGIPGDRMWVRETFRAWATDGTGTTDDGCWNVRYKADGENGKIFEPRDSTGFRYQWENFDVSPEECGMEKEAKNWTPSIHMPRFASRITLEVTGVRAERLQDISEEDAKEEGADRPVIGVLSNGQKMVGPYAHGFARLWDSIAKPVTKWTDNPWVWVITFRRVEK